MIKCKRCNSVLVIKKQATMSRSYRHGRYMHRTEHGWDKQSRKVSKSSKSAVPKLALICEKCAGIRIKRR